LNNVGKEIGHPRREIKSPVNHPITDRSGSPGLFHKQNRPPTTDQRSAIGGQKRKKIGTEGSRIEITISILDPSVPIN